MRLPTRRVLLALVGFIVALCAFGAGWGFLKLAQAAPTLTTDKPDYFSSEIVTVTGGGFSSNTYYDIPVIRPNGSIVKGDGSLIPGWDTVRSNGSGSFTYYYRLDGIVGTYEVRAYPRPWSGNLAEPPIATITFTDADIDFTQCLNDSDNNDVVDNCSWGTGAINGNNSIYVEGNSVPQRLFHKVADAGTHTMRFEYEFTKADVYAYDFISSPDYTMPPGPTYLNECADLPPFVTSTACASMFTASLAPVPSDPFDAVNMRENPASRNIRFGCYPSCTGTIVVSFPSLDGADDPGEGHVPDSDADCFQNCGSSVVRIDATFTTAATNTSVGIWFGGHLAQGSDPDPSLSPPDGWGTGYGASSISGSPFHMQYISLDGASVGKRDNQIQIGAVSQPPTATPTPTNTPTPTPTNTYTPTATPTNTYTPTPTNTSTPVSTNTFTPTPTNTYTPTNTSTPMPTNTSTPTPTSTFTPVPTNTFTPMPTDTSTPTPTSTFTPIPTSTYTPTATSTSTGTPTNTPTPTPTPTGGGGPTNTPVPPTPTPTRTPVPATPTPTRPPGVGGAVLLPPAAVAAESTAPTDDSDWSAVIWAAVAGVLGATALAVAVWRVRGRRLR